MNIIQSATPLEDLPKEELIKIIEDLSISRVINFTIDSVEDIKVLAEQFVEDQPAIDEDDYLETSRSRAEDVLLKQFIPWLRETLRMKGESA